MKFVSVMGKPSAVLFPGWASTGAVLTATSFAQPHQNGGDPMCQQREYERKSSLCFSTASTVRLPAQKRASRSFCRSSSEAAQALLLASSKEAAGERAPARCYKEHRGDKGELPEIIRGKVKFAEER